MRLWRRFVNIRRQLVGLSGAAPKRHVQRPTGLMRGNLVYALRACRLSAGISEGWEPVAVCRFFGRGVSKEYSLNIGWPFFSPFDFGHLKTMDTGGRPMSPTIRQAWLALPLALLMIAGCGGKPADKAAESADQAMESASEAAEAAGDAAAAATDAAGAAVDAAGTAAEGAADAAAAGAADAAGAAADAAGEAADAAGDAADSAGVAADQASEAVQP
jgi:hypothetical protein